MKRKVIIDCDPGIDDSLAIMLALSSPELDILGITITAGNAPLKQGFENAKKVLNHMDRLDVRVFLGADKPLVKEYVDALDTHGEDGLFAYELLFLSDKIITSASGMYYYVQNRKGQATKNINNVLTAEIPPIIKFKNLVEKYRLTDLYEKQITDKFISLFVGGGKFAQTRVTKMGLISLVKELNKYKQLIIEWHIDFNTINNKWQKIWFTRFINILKTSTVKAALFLKLMRIYRNIFIQPFKIKWYK